MISITLVTLSFNISNFKVGLKERVKGIPEVKTNFERNFVCSDMKQYSLGNLHVKF